jgi:predicted TIM-barrel fold metal-dependent hydrolase
LPICTRFSKSCQVKRNIEIIRRLLLKEETKEKILGGNAAWILGLGSDR